MLWALVEEPVSWEMLTIVAAVGFSAATTAVMVTGYLGNLRDRMTRLEIRYEEAHKALVARVDSLMTKQ